MDFGFTIKKNVLPNQHYIASKFSNITKENRINRDPTYGKNEKQILIGQLLVGKCMEFLQIIT